MIKVIKIQLLSKYFRFGGERKVFTHSLVAVDEQRSGLGPVQGMMELKFLSTPQGAWRSIGSSS